MFSTLGLTCKPDALVFEVARSRVALRAGGPGAVRRVEQPYESGSHCGPG